MNQKITNTLLTIIYFIVATAYCLAKAFYNKNYMYVLISLLVVLAFVYYKINSLRLDKFFCLALIFVFFGNFFHVNTDFNSLIYGTGLYFLFNLTISIIISKYTFNTNYKRSIQYHLPLLVVFLILQSLSLNTGKLSALVITVFYVQLVSLSIIAYRYYIKSVHDSSFFILFGIAFLLISYAFGGVNKLILLNPYYSFIDSMAFAVGLYFITKAVIIEDFYSINN